MIPFLRQLGDRAAPQGGIGRVAYSVAILIGQDTTRNLNVEEPVARRERRSVHNAGAQNCSAWRVDNDVLAITNRALPIVSIASGVHQLPRSIRIRCVRR